MIYISFSCGCVYVVRTSSLITRCQRSILGRIGKLLGVCVRGFDLISGIGLPGLSQGVVV